MRWFFSVPLVVLGGLFIIAWLSYKGILPFDFNTVRGYAAIVIIGVACLGIEIIGIKHLPKKGDRDG